MLEIVCKAIHTKEKMEGYSKQDTLKAGELYGKEKACKTYKR